MRGSEHNDEFYTDEFGRIRTRTNFSGGVQGGISNGERIDIRVAFKPTATIFKPQATVSETGEAAILQARATRPVRAAPRRADGRSDGRPRADRPRPAPPWAVWRMTSAFVLVFTRASQKIRCVWQ